MMEHLTASEINIFSSQIRYCRPSLPHPIGYIEWERTGWAKMRPSVLAKYKHMTRRVLLNIDYRRTPEYMFSSLCHELHHKWQHERWGARYWLMCNFLTRDYLLERTAREVERTADKLLGLEGLRDGD